MSVIKKKDTIDGALGSIQIFLNIIKNNNYSQILLDLLPWWLIEYTNILCLLNWGFNILELKNILHLNNNLNIVTKSLGSYYISNNIKNNILIFFNESKKINNIFH